MGQKVIRINNLVVKLYLPVKLTSETIHIAMLVIIYTACIYVSFLIEAMCKIAEDSTKLSGLGDTTTYG
jgi:hypothetical protein